MKSVAVLVAGILVAGLAVVLLDRALLKMETRGWIYYRRKRGHVDRLGDAALRIQSILEPGRRHVVEEKEKTAREAHDEAGPPDSTEGPGSTDPAAGHRRPSRRRG